MESTLTREGTMARVFMRQAERLGDRVLLHHHDGSAWIPVTWRQQQENAARVAASLVKLGVEPGDRVLLMAENRVEWLCCDLGIQLAGAISVPVYPSTVAKTAVHIANDAGAVVAIVSTNELASRLEGAGDLRHVVRMDGEVRSWIAEEAAEPERAEVARRTAAGGPDDVLTVIYTSGTTGEPKGVVLTNRNFVEMAANCLQAFPIGEHDVALSFLPYSHVLERVSSIAVGIMAGASAYLARGMDQLLEDIGDARPTIMVSVPRMYEKMFERVEEQVRQSSPLRRRLFNWAVGAGKKHSAGRPSLTYPLADRIVLSRLRTILTGGRLRFFVSGGAPLAIDVEEFFWAIGVKILQGWGMTETTSGATSNTERDHRYGTVGKALPGVEIKIAEDGEILVRGAGVMEGYYQNHRATEETLKDGWLHTGDVGELDADGFLKITDRKKDLIKTAGGKFVAPQPIEAGLQHNPLIERAVVVGDERPYCVALIVPNFDAARARLGLSGKPEQVVRDERLRQAVQRAVDEVNRDLGSWESIKYFELLPEDFREDKGEVTPTLKVKRRVVEQRHADEIEALYRSAKKPEQAKSAGAH